MTARRGPCSTGRRWCRAKPGSRSRRAPFATRSKICVCRRRRAISDRHDHSRRAAVPSFDIVSRIDLAEVDNALAGMTREIVTRFDFKGSKCTIERQEGMLTLLADDELKLKQMHELLKVHLTRRKVDPAALDFKPAEKASGNRLRQTVVLRQGVDANLARQLIREIKDSKLKVQVSIQGDELRVTGLKIDQPLQYLNFRD